jgi:protein SCO1/2
MTTTSMEAAAPSLPWRCSRRSFLHGLAVAASPAGSLAQSPTADHGRVAPPVAVPDIALVRHDGTHTTLSALVSQHATALQLMFTACTTTCPIQGAIFAQVQKLIPDQVARGIQLVSLSVDPERDTPQILAKWLRRFGSRAGWIAASPRATDTERLRDFAGRGRSASDNHSTRVQMLNRQGLLVWRTLDLPRPEEIAGILRSL